MLFRYVLLFILLFVVARVISRFLGGILQGVSGGGSSGAAQRPATPAATKMVVDPVCGTYVVPGRALELTRGRESLYFCSDTCRKRYLERA